MNVERRADPRGRFRFTRCAVEIPDAAPEMMDDPATFLPEALQAVNRLVEVFRFVTNRAYLPAVQESDVEFAEIRVPSTGIGYFHSNLGGVGNALINEPEWVHNRVRAALGSGEEVPLHAELLISARRMLGSGLYRQAVVEAVSSLDVLLDEVLNQARLDGTISHARHEEALDLVVTERLKAPLREATGSSPVDDDDLWRGWIEANRIRREAVHTGRSVTRDEAAAVIRAMADIGGFVGGANPADALEPDADETGNRG